MARTKKKKRPDAKRRDAADAKRERFAREHVLDLSVGAAAIRAGYAPKSAHVTGSRMLRNPKVAARVEQLKAEIAAKYNVTVERVLKGIARLAFGDIRTLYDERGNLKNIATLDEDAAALLAGVETSQIFEGSGEDREYVGDLVKVKVRSSERALAMAMSYLGMNKTGGTPGESGLVLSIRCSDGKVVR